MSSSLEPANYFQMKQYTQYTLFVPLTQNGGGFQPPAQLYWIEQQLIKLTGGLTRNFPGKGLWVSPSPSLLYQDIVVPFQLVIAQGSDQEQMLIQLTVEIAQVLEQEVIFICGQPVWLVNDAQIIS